MSAEKRACTTSRKKSRTLSTPTRPFQPEDIEAALRRQRPRMSFRPASAHRHRSSRAGMDDGRPGPPRSYRDLPIEAMGKTRPTGAEADPAISESSLSALPCPPRSTSRRARRYADLHCDLHSRGCCCDGTRWSCPLGNRRTGIAHRRKPTPFNRIRGKALATRDPDALKAL